MEKTSKLFERLATKNTILGVTGTTNLMPNKL